MAEVMDSQALGMDAHQTEEPKNLSPEDEFAAAFEEDEAAQKTHEPEPDGEEPQEEPEVPPVGDAATGEEPSAPPVEPEPHADAGSEGDDQRYKSMMGRLKASQAENLAMKTELSALKARLDELTRSQPRPQEETVPVEGIDGLSESIRPLFTENSREGATLRKTLEEYGPEHASVLAEAMLAKREARDATSEMKQQFAVDADARHKMALAQAHPEYADAILEKDAAKAAELMNGVHAWIGVLPYAEGAEMMRILNNGTTYEVSGLLAKYKQFRSGGAKKPAAQPKAAAPGGAAERIARSNVAVPGTGKAMPPKEKATDFETAWDEAPD